MKLVIVGFGRVGRRTARTLGSEGHEVVIVERDAARADRAREDGFAVVTGDGADEAVLAEAGLDDADAVAGLTGDVNTNYSACLVAAGCGCRTVLRVGEDLSDELYERYAGDVDEIIYPERLGAVGAKTALMCGDFNVIADLTEHLSLASVTIPEGSPAVGRRVVGLDLPGDVRVYAHGRADEDMRVPLPKTTIRAGDRLAVMAAPDQVDAVREALGR
jgi:trk system potassium uptake protein TrkA